MLPSPTTAYDIEHDDDGEDGYAFGRPCGIAPAQWPRSRVNGLPMAHLFTVRVPEQYRGAGAQYVALAMFQADDHVADEVDGVADVLAGGRAPQTTEAAAAFWTAVSAYAAEPHPREHYMEDDIGGGWALLWLTAEELAGAPCPLPDPAARLPEYDPVDGMDCYRADRPAQPLRLVVRQDDPNVGVPIEDEDAGYVDPYSEPGKQLGLTEVADCHFGGTMAYFNGKPSQISPCYLEFSEQLGDANLGGGNALVDLTTAHIDWSCS